MVNINKKDTQPITTKALRQFGLMFAIVVIIIFAAFLPWVFSLDYPQWPWYLALGFSLVAVVFPKALYYPYRGWMLFGAVMAEINSRIILAILFYLLFLPIGLLFKIIGKDPLFRRYDKTCESYRVLSEKNDAERFKDPF